MTRRDLTPLRERVDAVRAALEAYPPQTLRLPCRVLAIDPGVVNLAFALIDDSDILSVPVTSKIELPKYPSIGQRVRHVEEVVACWVSHEKPDMIAKEGVSHASSNGVADSGRVQYAIERVAIEAGIPMVTLSPMTVRSFLGSSSKSDTKLRIWQRYQVETQSEDEADAYAIGRCGLAMARGEWEMPSVREARLRAERKAAKALKNVA